ncbi:MAG: NUDIX domain-containing protein [Cellvibrionaceae bacterium]|nr:NUDIX domain-containing protein [Cellvibrionaceae bacterium]
MNEPIDVLPQFTVDNVIFGYDTDQLKILLVKHGEGASVGEWGLPGDWLKSNETLEAAAERILFNRTSIKDIPLNQMHTFSAIDRYPGKRIITTAYYTVINVKSQKIAASDDELDAGWFNIKELPNLIFDHGDILQTGLEKFRHQVRHQPIGINLLPEKFTFFQLQQLYETILDQKFDKPNFRRKMLSQNYLVNCEEQYKAGKHRTATLYRFDSDCYRELINQGFSFNL